MHIENHHGLSKCQARLFPSSIHALVDGRLINVVVLCHELQHIVSLELIETNINFQLLKWVTTVLLMQSEDILHQVVPMEQKGCLKERRIMEHVWHTGAFHEMS